MGPRLVYGFVCLCLCLALCTSSALGQVAPSAPAKAQRFDPEGFPLPEGALYRLGSIRLRDPQGSYDFVLVDGGKTLLSAGVDGVIRSWDLSTGKVKRAVRIKDEREFSDHITLSPNGKVAMVEVNTQHSFSKQDPKLILFDTASGKEIKSLSTSATWAISRELSPDGAHIAMSTWLRDGRLRTRLTLQDKATGTEREASLHYTNKEGIVITGGSFAPNGKWFIVCGFEDEPCRVIDVATGADVCRLGKWNVETTAFSADSKLLVLSCLPLGEADNKSSLRLVKMPGGELFARFPTESTFTSLTLSHDGKVIAGGADKLFFIDAATGQVRNRIKMSADKLLFTPDDKTLVSNSKGTIQLFDVATAKEIPVRHSDLEICGEPAPVMAPNGRTLAFLDREKLCITLCDLPKGELILRMPISADELYGLHQLVFRDNGTRISALGELGNLLTWDVATGKPEKRLELRNRATDGNHDWPKLSYDGRQVAAILSPRRTRGDNSPNRLTVRDVNTGAVIRSNLVPKDCWQSQWMPDGRSMLLRSKNDYMLVNIANGAELARFEAPNQPSQDGRLLAGSRAKARELKDIIIWEGVTGKEIAILPVGPDSFSSDEFFGDNRSLISVNEHFVNVWDLDTQKVRFQLSLDYESAGIKEHFRITDALLLPCGRQLLTSLRDGTALVWDLAPAFPSPRQKAEMPADKELTAQWSALASDDARLAYKAVWRLEELPRSLPFVIDRLLKDRLDPNSQIARALVAQLDSDKFQVRQKAQDDLEAMGGSAVPALREALARANSPEVKRRLEQLLTKWPANTISPLALRRLRALQILEHANTAESRQALADLAKNPFSEKERDDAQAAIDRLDKTGRRKVEAP